jgi:hypothetical protein
MKVIIAWDGDHIGREVGRASLADDVDGLRRISQAIDRGNKIWESWVTMNGGSMISYGGDEGRAEINAEKLSELPKIRDQYASAVEASVSVGVGTKLSEADKALMAAKLQGGDKIVLYTPEVDEIIAKANEKPKTEADKLSEEYLNKAQPGANEGDHAGFAGASKPSAPTIDKPSVEASEHSQGEAAQATADNAPKAPEATHAADDLEGQFHDLAGKQQQQDQAQGQPQPGTTEDQLRLQVVQVLQALKAQAPILEQVKQSAPDTYEAVMGLAQAVIMMARTMNGQPPNQTSQGEVEDRAQSNAMLEVPLPPEEGGDKKEGGDDTKKSEKESWHDCKDFGHCWGEGETGEHCLLCGCHQSEAELEKASLNPAPKAPAQHHHLMLPVGSKKDTGPTASREVGKIKVQHQDNGQPGKQTWIEARAGQVLSQDGHAISSRNPGGK